MITDQDQIKYLNFMCRTYEGMTKLITSTKLRIQSLSPEIDAKKDDIIREMESQKGKLSRRVKKEMEFWPIWSEWLDHVPGIGPAIGGNLILLYYYRFTPACQNCDTPLEKKDGTFWCAKCEKSVKGEGNLNHRLELKNFPKISSWWHYMGRHVVDGKVPKRQKGAVCDWSTPGRQIGFQIGQSFLKKGPGHKYRAFYDSRRKLREKTHPDATKMHRMNMALNETIKLFLSHFWQVARTIDELPVTEPYIKAKDQVHNIIEPYYWDRERALKRAA